MNNSRREQHKNVNNGLSVRKEGNNKTNSENESRKSPNMQDIGKEKNEIEIKWLEKRNYNAKDTKYKEERVRLKLRRRKTKRRKR